MTSRFLLFSCALSLLAGTSGCSDDDSSGSVDAGNTGGANIGDVDTGGANIGDGNTGGANIGDGNTGGANIGDVDTATGGASQGPTCDAPLLDLNDFEATMGGATELEAISGTIRAMEGVGADLYVITSEGLYHYADDATEGILISDELPKLPGSTAGSGRGYMRVDEAHAYHRTADGIARTPLDGGPSEVLFEGLDGQLVMELVLRDEQLHFGIVFSGEFETGIYSLPLEGGEPPTLVTGQIYPDGMTESEGVFYGGNGNDYLSRYTPGDEAPTTLTDFTTHILPHVELVEVVGNQIFWSDGGSIYSCNLPDCVDPTVHGGSAKNGLSVHGDNIYYSNDSLSWLSLDGAGCGTLVAGDFPNNISAYALTDGYAYVSDGRLFRMPLPK